MFKLITAIGRGYDNYMTRQGRVQAHRILSSQSDWTLNDLGVSRQLLNGGVKNWPWKITNDQPSRVEASRESRRKIEARAIRELNSYSNKELHDLGITRGSIPEAVRNGRPESEHAA